jgi:hypothetical protein
MNTDQLTRIEEALDKLAKIERKTNGFQVWLWIVNVIVLPGLGYCVFNVVQITGDRYTPRDAIEHQEVHHQEALSIGIMQAKLAGVPSQQIDENRLDIKAMKAEIEKIKFQISPNND